MDDATKKIIFIVSTSGTIIPLYLFFKLHLLVFIFALPILISGIIIGYMIRDHRARDEWGGIFGKITTSDKTSYAQFLLTIASFPLSLYYYENTSDRYK